MQSNPIDTTVDLWQKHGTVSCGHEQQFGVRIYSSYSPECPEMKARVRLYGTAAGFASLEMALTPDAAISLADALKAAAATASEVQAAVDAARVVGAQQGSAA